MSSSDNDHNNQSENSALDSVPDPSIEKPAHHSVADANLDSVNDEKMGSFISRLLIGGLLCSIVLVTISAVMFISANPHVITNYKVFTGEPADLRAIDAVLRDAFKGNLRAVMQLGVVVLIATPVARVAFSVLTFALEKDIKYVVFSSLVLAGLLYSLVCAI